MGQTFKAKQTSSLPGSQFRAELSSFALKVAKHTAKLFWLEVELGN